MPVTIQERRDTAANWTSANPVLHSGESGLETDTGLAKIGDGVTAWTALAYWPPLRLPGAVTVSPYGIANSGSTIANAGAQYGPDTPGTVTFGIQEAVNAAVAGALAGAAPDVLLLPGKFTLSQFTNATYRAEVPPGFRTGIPIGSLPERTEGSNAGGQDGTSAATVTATTLTLPASMGSAVTGYVILEGY